MLFADVFEAFQNTCIEHYKLDPVHFYTALRLEWQILLNTASEYCELGIRHKDFTLCPEEFTFELFRDIEMLLLLEKDFWGGITQAVKRYAKYYDKYMKEQYNRDEARKYPHYLDANKLLGQKMVQKLPKHRVSRRNR